MQLPFFHNQQFRDFSKPEVTSSGSCLAATKDLFSVHRLDSFLNSYVLLAFLTSCGSKLHALIMIYMDKDFLPFQHFSSVLRFLVYKTWNGSKTSQERERMKYLFLVQS